MRAVACFTNTEAKVMSLSLQIAFEYKEQSLSSHTSTNSWNSISVHRFFNFDTTITLSSDSCNKIFTSFFDWRACHPFNPLAVASHLLSSYAEYFGSLWDFPSTTSIHPNRSNILAVKNELGKDETQDPGHPTPSYARLQKFATNFFWGALVKTCHFGGQICFSTSFLVKSKGFPKSLYHTCATQMASKMKHSNNTPGKLKPWKFQRLKKETHNFNPYEPICIKASGLFLGSLHALKFSNHLQAYIPSMSNIPFCLQHTLDQERHTSFVINLLGDRKQH